MLDCMITHVLPILGPTRRAMRVRHGRKRHRDDARMTRICMLSIIRPWMKSGQRYVTPGERHIMRGNPLQGILQVGLSIERIEIREICTVHRATKIPATTKTTYTKIDVDTETEIVCQVGVNARDA